ncbi:uncharacterized protein MONOS_18014 [Monocercomonoides exilis]|uniref:uncharacterized protein n=1 Tax=Monocercomonoides exilis TaxID=2049356 RepID=UPI00355AAA53|nr:hypothetical protein MONOS_18014 [Monocercomonoides exilis]
MLVDEEKEEEEERNEKLLINLYECYILLSPEFLPISLSICVPCLLKAALKKEEKEETQKETEIALLALSNIGSYRTEKELYLNEIKEVILNHQERHNLTRLAYQSAWRFLMNEFEYDEGLEGVIVNKMHFIEDTTKELEELIKNIDWKREKEEERGKEAKELLILMKWLEIIRSYFFSCKIWNEKYVDLISSIIQILRASRDGFKDIYVDSLFLLKGAAEKGNVKIDDLLKGRAIDLILEEIKRRTVDKDI